MRRRIACSAYHPIGCTLAELLVALVLFAIGLVSLATTASRVARLQSAATRRSLAAATAQSTFERLRATHCTPPSGVDSIAGVIERWQAMAAAGNVRVLVDSLTIPGDPGRTAHVEAYRSAAPC